MHESQQEVERNDEYSIFTLCIRPVFDFQQELLRNGSAIEVLEPLWLLKTMAAHIRSMWSLYKDV
ncbi:MAG: WYL domain-containing protein [Paludibacteraceae bacterium]|nr:WYL domain-containing protein [Paludibacteraceae bacterium]